MFFKIFVRVVSNALLFRTPPCLAFSNQYLRVKVEGLKQLYKKGRNWADFITNQATTNTIEDVNKVGKEKSSTFIQSLCDI